MYKYLVVGCGGSGAKTVAYMMDQLKALLREVDPSIKSLPKAWQFVSIDSPVQPEAGPEGLPNVVQAGGRYIGIGSTQPYATFDGSVTDELVKNKALKEAATWMTRYPEKNSTPISDGAGQYRAIGRVLTIPNLKHIRDGLNNALDEMNLTESISELNALNLAVSGHNSNAQGTQPIILVVTSMAGGSGASMFLDVCRVLSTLDKGNPENTGVFVMTPEVFEDIPKEQMLGAWPNSLAMFGEVIATQTGAATDSDARLYKALGIGNASRPATFARLFPVGNRMGPEQARFGDGDSLSIYRGLGRALSALMYSEKASSSFKQYSLGNPGSPDANRSYLGWADPAEVNWSNIPWGTMGFAQLSLGRDKYAEYAAQRLARASFDRLLEGHIDSRTDRTGEEQLNAKVNERFPRMLKEMRIFPEFANIEPPVDRIGTWLYSVFEDEVNMALDKAIRAFKTTAFLPTPTEGQRGDEWVAEIQTALHNPDNARRLMRGFDNEAYAAVHKYANDLTNSLISLSEKELAAVGVRYLEVVLSELNNIFQMKLSNGVRLYQQAYSGQNILREPEAAHAVLTPLTGRGRISNGQGILDEFAGLFRKQFGEYMLCSLARNLSPVFDDFRIDVLGRLSKEVQKAHKDLESAAKKKVLTLNLADVATDHPNAWPTERDEKVAERFMGAFNEILVTDVENFPRDYESHILKTVRVQSSDVNDVAGATKLATQAVILGKWETTASEKAPEDTLAPKESDHSKSNRAGWVPMSLQAPPFDEGEPREVSNAVFTAKIRPEDLLRRARDWVNRPDYYFERFITTDLRSYMQNNEDLPDSEHEARIQKLRSAFAQALSKARPLAAVNSTMVQQVHNTKVVNRYTFSEIPLEDLNAVEDLFSVLDNLPNIDQQTLSVFKDALTDSDRIQRIDIFGSYPNYSPIVFSSLLPHIANDWASRQTKTSFWRDRRTRTLDASLPLSIDERQALVAGWILGRAIGQVFVRNEGQADASAWVYDQAQKTWLSFPTPLLTDTTKMRNKVDWMAVVIESILLAYANSHQRDDRQLLAGSLHPYHVLRGIFDTGKEGPTNVDGGVKHPAVSKIAAFLRTGERPNQSPVGSSVDERVAYLEEKLVKTDRVASQFIDDQQGFSPIGEVKQKDWANPPSRQYASNMPYFRDFAADVREMVAILRRQLVEAKQIAEQPEVFEDDIFSSSPVAPSSSPAEFGFGDGDIDLSGI